MKAVRFEQHGGIDVLQVVDAARPEPGPGEVLVAVRAAAINLLDSTIREGYVQSVYPVAAYPSGQGLDFAGVVEGVGPKVVELAAGDEVLGFLLPPGHAQAEYIVAPVNQMVRKPAGVGWTVAGGLYTAGTAAYASVRAVGPQPGETVVIAGAAGGVGSIAVQLARRAGAKVVGIASARNHVWLESHGVTPVAYGKDMRLKTPTAFIDTVGDGYVKLAIELGVAPERINTVIDFAAAAQYGTHADGNQAAGTTQALAELAALVDKGEVEVPIAATYSFDEVRQAYEVLEQRHTRGKIVLEP
ncbi:NADP-dependent oxidoreductase [Kribbella sancticallisti]|uniref:NADP-dependent oxidoreductase n=1 Tax=Kribbella sancticallisti TaxID=460087 RepID=A0ABN2EC53_9ACTN